MLFAIVASLVLTQGAPSDIPRDHWAFKAVDELFVEGILHGYPSSDVLRLIKIKPDDAFLNDRLSRWKRDGLCVGYPDGMLCHRGDGPPTNYEQAVMAHAVWANIVGISEDLKASPQDRAALVPVLSDLVRAISMRAPELIKLGADTNEMVSRLEVIRLANNGVTFNGSR